jgi:hypothetical protein
MREFGVVGKNFSARRAIDPQPATAYTAGASERVAQMVEHVTFNHGVEGSIPSALTKQINGLVCLSNSASAGLVSGQRRKSSAL